MTYGWAFLVMTAVIGALVTLDPLDAGPSINRCDTGSEYVACDEQTALLDEEDDSVRLRLRNTRRESITVDNVSVESVAGGTTSSPCSAPGVVGAGDWFTVLCHNTSFDTSDTTDVSLTYQYYKTSVGQKYSRSDTLTVQGSPGDAGIVTHGLIAHWPLNGDGADATSPRFSGTVKGDPRRVEGQVNTALRFDGEDDWIRVPHNKTLQFDRSPFTITLWTKPVLPQPAKPSYIAAIIGSGQCCDAGYTAGIETGTDKLHFDTQSTEEVARARHSISKEGWMHLALLHNGSASKLFIDGQLVGSDTGKVDSLVAYLGIGSSSQGGWGRFKGVIDDVRLYNRSLSKTEIQSLYQRPS